MSISDYPTRTAYFICLLPKLAIVILVALKGFGYISWPWFAVGGLALAFLLLWLFLDRYFIMGE